MILSVLLPVYNAGKFLNACLDSICNQTFGDFEVIAIDDGSTDDSAGILKQYSEKDSRIRVFSNPDNLGLIDTLNKGLTYCQGEFIARMDADDMILKDRFQLQIDFLKQHQDVHAVSSWMTILETDGKETQVRYRTDPDDIKSTLIFYSPVSHAASMFRADTLKKLGYRKEYRFAEDYDLWVRFLTGGYNLSVIPEYLYQYRTHGSQSTNPLNNDIMKESLKKIAINLQETFKLKPSKATADFHVRFLMLNAPLENLTNFLEWDAYLRAYSESFRKSGFIRSDNFDNFVFINFWQGHYSRFSQQLKLRPYINVMYSPFNKFPLKHKMKKLLSTVTGI